MIDHTLLKPDATRNQIMQLCKEAKEYKFATVCVNPYWVATAFNELQGSNVGITTVVGFPLGSTTTSSKVSEAHEAIEAGATEIDMVLNIGALKSGDVDIVKKDIEKVVLACKNRAIVKVIIETGFLTQEEKIEACSLAKSAGANFVKTSTGFGPGKATPEDIALMRKTVGPEMGVKASAGIRDIETVRRLVHAGATRIGASASIDIINGNKAEGSY
ncbi:deoxyribose-phosphate aldolase [Mesobacillus maritimus]|uniref:deoxyribose-phosphate aldolase n=1 Tax=Mesobacillus maritimus TaxID=1643336 RepID=UPI0038503488